MIEAVYVFITGLALGSFANVLIFRLPRENTSPFKGRSACPNCGTMIKWYHNIPLLSYIFLGGKCYSCKWKIPFRYPTVEFLMGALFTLFFLKLDRPLGADFLVLMTGLYVIFTAIVNTYIDLDFMILPDEITLSGIPIALGIASIGYFFDVNTIVTIQNAFVGALLGAGILMAVRVLGELIFKKEAMGLGDVKYMAMLGGLFGYTDIALLLFIACILGSFVGILYKILYKESYIPFGPFLAIASIILLFYREEIRYFIEVWVLNPNPLDFT